MVIFKLMMHYWVRTVRKACCLTIIALVSLWRHSMKSAVNTRGLVTKQQVQACNSSTLEGVSEAGGSQVPVHLSNLTRSYWKDKIKLNMLGMKLSANPQYCKIRKRLDEQKLITWGPENEAEASASVILAWILQSWGMRGGKAHKI